MLHRSRRIALFLVLVLAAAPSLQAAGLTAGREPGPAPGLRLWQAVVAPFTALFEKAAIFLGDPDAPSDGSSTLPADPDAPKDTANAPPTGPPQGDPDEYAH